MHRPTSGQRSLFAADVWLSDGKQARLTKSWAGVFQREMLPILVKMEPDFAQFYHPDKGAPNKPVATLLGLLLLKEAFDLTDEEVVDRFEFDLQWQHALDTPTISAHVCAKTLYNFRQKLLKDTTLQELFTSVVDEIIEKWNVKTDRHRIDSTQVVSNMKLLGRVGLFVKTIEQFLGRVARKDKALTERLPKRFRERYMERRGYFADVKSSKAPRRLQESAEDLWYLIDRFRGHEEIANLKAYKTMVRLFNDQCEVVKVDEGEGEKTTLVVQDRVDPPSDSPSAPAASNDAETEPTADPDAPSEEESEQEPSIPITVKKAGEIASDSLQSPSDTDATYSGHKGKGYQVQVVETCNEDNPFQVIDYVEVEGAHESDQNAPARIHKNLRERGHNPRESFVDSAFISGENIVKANDEGVDLIGPMSGVEPTGKKLSLAEFQFTADRRTVQHCPAGQAPLRQEPSRTDGVVNAHFDRAVCDTCPLAGTCPTTPTRKTRRLRFGRTDVAIAQRRQQEETDDFKEAYKIRSGVEATIGHLKNERGMGHVRVRGSPAVNLAVTFKVLAENCFRAVRHVLEKAKPDAQAPVAAAA